MSENCTSWPNHKRVAVRWSVVNRIQERAARSTALDRIAETPSRRHRWGAVVWSPGFGNRRLFVHRVSGGQRGGIDRLRGSPVGDLEDRLLIAGQVGDHREPGAKAINQDSLPGGQRNIRIIPL